MLPNSGETDKLFEFYFYILAISPDDQVSIRADNYMRAATVFEADPVLHTIQKVNEIAHNLDDVDDLELNNLQQLETLLEYAATKGDLVQLFWAY